jgi:uncharacterized protein YeaO (DUF488 family)
VTTGRIGVARVRDAVAAGAPDGFLVDRLWPRGVPKAALAGVTWLPDVGPSPGLRRWFGHDPARWDEFRRRYAAELDDHPEVWRPLAAAAVAGAVTLLHGSRDVEHNNAVALREYLLDRLGGAGR